MNKKLLPIIFIGMFLLILLPTVSSLDYALQSYPADLSNVSETNINFTCLFNSTSSGKFISNVSFWTDYAGWGRKQTVNVGLPLIEGLTHYYKLDEASGTVVYDSLGFTNGTNFDAVVNQAGIINKAYSFVSNDYLYLGSSTNFLSGKNKMGLSIWAKNSDFTSNQYLISSDNGGNFADSTCSIQFLSGNINVYCFAGGSILIASFSNSTSSLSTGVWNNYVLTLDTTYLALYVNGVLFNNKTRSSLSSITNTANNLAIGRLGTFNGNYFVGYVDEIAFWNKTLYPEDVVSLWNSGSGRNFNLFNQTIQERTQDFDYTLFSGMKWACQMGYTDGTSLMSITNYTVYLSSMTILDRIYNNKTFETNNEKFSILINYSLLADTSAILNYDGVNYSSTKIVNGTIYNFTASVDIPASSGNKSFYWIVSNNQPETIISNTRTQEVYPILFGFCNATLNSTYLNISFKDETTNSFINGAIPLGQFNYYLGNGGTYKTETYSNYVDTAYYTFCFSNSTQQMKTNYTIQYESSGYPQRTISESKLLSSTPTSKILYLLSAADAREVSFQIENVAQQLIQGATVTISREIGGVPTVVGVGTTDGSGIYTTYLNPSYVHTIVVEAEGYTDYSTNIFPTQSTYTITIGEVANVTKDYSKGVTYQITPPAGSLTGGEEYKFSLNLKSSYYELEGFGFNAYDNESMALPLGQYAATNGGYLEQLYTPSGTLIKFVIYWTVNSTITNVTYFYPVSDYYTGSNLSISQFFRDLKDYSETGMFGLDSWGLSILIFFVMFFITGIISYRYGLQSPASLIGIVFGLVLLFDVGLGLITIDSPNPIVQHFLTIIFGLATIGLIIREMQR